MLMKIILIASLSCGCALCLSSCYVPPGPPLVGVGAGVGYYHTLPRGYNVPYYYHNNRYYYGGRWEPGRYTYQGRPYSGRYYHDGHYLYGGAHFGHPHY